MATVYTAWVDNNRIWFNKSTDDGENFGTPATIDDGVTSNITRHSPKMQVDADGDVYVVWVRKNTATSVNTLVTNHTDDGGSSWSGCHTISDVPGTMLTEYIGFIIDSSGYLWVLFGQQTWKPGVWYYKSTNVKDYDTWDNEVYITLSLEPTSQIEVCEDPNGWLWIAYLNGGDIRCHRYNGRWIRQADVETGGTLSDLSITAGPNHVYVAYHLDGTGAQIRRKHNGGWQAAVTIAEVGQWPSIGKSQLWSMTVGTTGSMEVNQQDSDDAGQTWSGAAERSHGEGDGEDITGHKAVDYAETPYCLFVTASHKVFCCKGIATE